MKTFTHEEVASKLKERGFTFLENYRNCYEQHKIICDVCNERKVCLIVIPYWIVDIETFIRQKLLDYGFYF